MHEDTPIPIASPSHVVFAEYASVARLLPFDGRGRLGAAAVVSEVVVVALG